MQWKKSLKNIFKEIEDAWEIILSLIVGLMIVAFYIALIAIIVLLIIAFILLFLGIITSPFWLLIIWIF